MFLYTSVVYERFLALVGFGRAKKEQVRKRWVCRLLVSP